MSKTARFQSAVPRARPAGSRIIEAYSLKLGRRLQCFGEVVFEQWIRLEVDPTIQTFCERPLDLNFADEVLQVDFWVPAQRSPARRALPMRKLWPPIWRIAARFAAEQASIQQEGAHRHHAAAMELFCVFLIASI